jgi:AcrR family transcriptional regulator
LNRQQQKENTRRKLLDTALEVFSRNGITTTRMSDVAEAAGVSHGTVFLHFETQDALISAVIEDFGFRMASRTHELAGGSGSVKEILAAHLRGIGEHEGFYTRLIIETSHLPPAARNALTGIQSAISFHISQAAEREMAAGTIKRMPVALFFNTWVGLVHYYLSNKDQFAPDGSIIETCGPLLLEHYMNMISRENHP